MKRDTDYIKWGIKWFEIGYNQAMIDINKNLDLSKDRKVKAVERFINNEIGYSGPSCDACDKKDTEDCKPLELGCF